MGLNTSREWDGPDILLGCLVPCGFGGFGGGVEDGVEDGVADWDAVPGVADPCIAPRERISITGLVDELI